VFETYKSALRDLFADGKRDSLFEEVDLLLGYLWENRDNPQKRTASAVDSFVRKKFPTIKAVPIFRNRRATELQKCLKAIGESLRRDPSVAIPFMMVLTRLKRAPWELQFKGKEGPRDLGNGPVTKDFEAFWLPYRNQEVQTKIVLGQPLFLSNKETQLHRIEPVDRNFQQQNPGKQERPFVRMWDVRSALQLQDLLSDPIPAASGGSRKPERHESNSGEYRPVLLRDHLKIELSEDHEPIDDNVRLKMRRCNIIALGYPRENAILRDYQKRHDVPYRVMPESDPNEKGGDEAAPRVVDALSRTLVADMLGGLSEEKACVLTRRLHNGNSNAVTLIAANSQRVVGAVVDRLTEAETANELFGHVRAQLGVKQGDRLPLEFQCVFIVEFMSGSMGSVAVSKCVPIRKI